jgi:hypothetical protein
LDSFEPWLQKIAMNPCLFSARHRLEGTSWFTSPMRRIRSTERWNAYVALYMSSTNQTTESYLAHMPPAKDSQLYLDWEYTGRRQGCRIPLDHPQDSRMGAPQAASTDSRMVVRVDLYALINERTRFGYNIPNDTRSRRRWQCLGRSYSLFQTLRTPSFCLIVAFVKINQR